MSRPTLRRLAAALTVLLLTGCSSGADGGRDSDTAGERTPVAAESPGSEVPSLPDADSDAPLEDRIVALDPGHNGDNAANPSVINEPVPDGRGGTKACNTTGTATADGHPEHAFNWAVSEIVREQLQERGAEVVMSRNDDDGIGPCVDERGQFAGGADADVLISIHANGTEDPQAKGFHMIVVDEADEDVLEEESLRAAEHFVDSFEAAEFTKNSAYGDDGIVSRSDIAGLNHAAVPAVLVECGEMRNREEAELMASTEGHERYAAAITAGVEEYLLS